VATSRILIPLQAAIPPDGSGTNKAAQLEVWRSTAADPKPFAMRANFDPGTAEWLWFAFRMPGDYVSGGALKLSWMTNAITGSVVWGARVGAITPADVDTPMEHAIAAAATTTTAANATEARRLVETSVTLTMDSAAAGDYIMLGIFRDAANGSDTLSVDAELLAIAFEYTS
jgi:hypothetical protein